MCIRDSDIIFGLYSPKELVEWDQEINHGSDGSSEEHYLCLDSEVAKELYEMKRTVIGGLSINWKKCIMDIIIVL